MTHRRRSSSQRGSNLVETALVLLGLLFLIFGIMETAHLVYAYNFVERAAAEAARWASVRGSSAASPATAQTITTYVRRWATGLDASSLTVATTWKPDNSPGGTVRVQVDYTWKSAISGLLPTTVSLRGSSAMLILQ